MYSVADGTKRKRGRPSKQTTDMQGSKRVKITRQGGRAQGNPLVGTQQSTVENQ